MTRQIPLQVLNLAPMLTYSNFMILQEAYIDLFFAISYELLSKFLAIRRTNGQAQKD